MNPNDRVNGMYVPPPTPTKQYGVPAPADVPKTPAQVIVEEMVRAAERGEKIPSCRYDARRWVEDLDAQIEALLAEWNGMQKIMMLLDDEINYARRIRDGLVGALDTSISASQ